MFANLTERFHRLFNDLRGTGVIAEAHLVQANVELRDALLAADVHHTVIEAFLKNVETAALGQQVAQGLRPVDHYLKILHHELSCTLGGAAKPMPLSGKPPIVILCVGLQGSGKTTTVAKLGAWYKKQGRRPMLLAADLARPAAVEQLQTLANDAGLRITTPAAGTSVLTAVEDGLAAARAQLCDLVIVDTAGRLHIDAPLMDELRRVAKICQPVQTLLVVDAMAGQSGLAAAQGFHAAVPLTGMVLSKADGDARGGVALSCASVIGAPIYFVGTGERLDALEMFRPDRVAARILDIGDLATFTETVEAIVDRETAAKRAATMATGRWTLEDYREQLRDVGKLGQWERLVGMLPGGQKMAQQLDSAQIARDLRRKLAIIDSMTPVERCDIRVLNGSRRKRIAIGSGTTVTDVNRLVKEFETLQLMMKRGHMGRGMQGMPFGKGWVGTQGR